MAEPDPKSPPVSKSERVRQLRAASADAPLFDRTTEAQRRTFQPLKLRAERGSEFLEFVEPRRRSGELVLAASVEKTLFDVVQEYRQAELIRRHHIPVRNRLLFCGPPGCGKSVTAETFAHEVGMPLMVAKLDTLIGSLLGETASNLKKVFEGMEREASVLFLDEFDALARSRSDPTEHSEMRRVVNSLLMMIDRFSGRGFIIAATNLEAEIDTAIFRRFDEVVLFERPSLVDIRRLLKLRTKNFAAEFDIASRAKRLLGKSHADVERICYNGIRHAIIDKRRIMRESDFDYAIAIEERRELVQERISQERL